MAKAIQMVIFAYEATRAMYKLHLQSERMAYYIVESYAHRRRRRRGNDKQYYRIRGVSEECTQSTRLLSQHTDRHRHKRTNTRTRACRLGTRHRRRFVDRSEENDRCAKRMPEP